METQNHLLVSNSVLQSHQKELEEMRARVKREEKEKDSHDDRSKNVARETSQVVQSIKNVYARCQATMRNKPQVQPPNKESNMYDLLTSNLDVIHARIMDLIEISNEYKSGADTSNGSSTSDLRELSGFTMTTGPTSQASPTKPGF